MSRCARAFTLVSEHECWWVNFARVSLNGDAASEGLCDCATLDVSAVNYSTVEEEITQ